MHGHHPREVGQYCLVQRLVNCLWYLRKSNENKLEVNISSYDSYEAEQNNQWYSPTKDKADHKHHYSIGVVILYLVILSLHSFLHIFLQNLIFGRRFGPTFQDIMKNWHGYMRGDRKYNPC